MAGQNFEISGEEKKALEAIKRVEKAFVDLESTALRAGKAIDSSMNFSGAGKGQKELQQELSKTGKAALDALSPARKEQSEFVNKTAEGAAGLSKMGGIGKIAIGGALVGALMAVVSVITNAIASMRDFVAESVKIATSAEGVERAFKGLNNPELLRNLRESTKGTVNDFELMKAAVKADNFSIPVEKLGSLLQFAQQKAADTGESVDYLVDSLVTGLGRKSVMILDNLQIDIAQLQKRVKESGDFMATAIEMINEKLAEQGDLALTAADKEQIAAARRENAQMKIGSSLIGLKNIASSVSATFYEAIAGMAERYLPSLMRKIEEIANKFIDWYNSSEALRSVFASVYLNANVAFSFIKETLKNILDGFGAVADVGKKLFAFDFEGALDSMGDYFTKVKKNRDQFYKETVEAAIKSSALVKKQADKLDITSTLEANARKKKKSPLNEITEEELKERQKILDTSLRLENESIQKLLDAKDKKLEIEKLELDTIRDSYSKRQKLIELQHKQDLLGIEKRANELVKKQQEIEKLEWEKNGSIGLFTPTTRNEDGLDEVSRKELADRREIAKKIRDFNLQINKEEYEKAFLQYRSLEEQKAKLREEYANKISEAEVLGLGDETIANLKKTLAESLAALDFDDLKKTFDWGLLFGDLESVTTDTLKTVISQLEELRDKNAEVWTPEQLKVFNEQIEKGKLLLADRTPFDVIKTALNEYESASRDIKDIQEEINRLKSEDADNTEAIADAQKRLLEAENKRLSALKKTTQAINAIGREGSAIVGSMGELIGMFENFGVSFSDSMKGALDSVGQIMSGLEKIDLTKPMTIVTGAVSVLSGIGNAVASLFGGGEDGTAYYERVRAQLDAINDIYDKIIAKNKEEITFGGGFASINAASSALENYYKKLENLQKIADASGRSGSSWKSHSAEWHSNKNVGADNFNKMSQIVGKSIKSMNDLYNLTGDELYLLQRKMTDAWGLIDERIRENLQSIIDCKDEARELQAALNEALTGVSQDAFYNDFINNLSNLEMSFEDMCDNFEADLRKSIIAGLVADQYKGDIDNLYKSWAAAAESDEKITKEEVEHLRKMRDELLQGMMKDRESLAETFGWETNSPYSQSGSKGYSVSMSQDTGDMLVGINTGVLEGVISIRESLKMMESMSVSNKTNINSIAQDMQLLVDSNFKSMYYLQDIATYTKVLPNMASDMEQVKKNTGKLFGN